jgi:PHD/YefM family antitoxin component YafN of YafNO toxin-antitoxin module
MREFRANLQQYLLMSSPVSITRHGETVGYYIPTRTHSEEASDLYSLKQAAAKLDQLMAAHGITEEAIVSEFKELKAKRAK